MFQIDPAAFKKGRVGKRPFQALLEQIRAGIESGALQPGDRLPPQRELADTLGLAVGTVTKAYSQAARQRLVSTEVGRGTFVLGRTSGRTEAGTERYDLTFNHVAYEEAHPAALGASLSRIVSRAERAEVYAYDPVADTTEARTQAARWLAWMGQEADARRIVLCNGVQHGLALLAQCMAGPGGVMLTEQLGYPGIGLLGSILGFTLRGAAIDEYGLRTDVLEARLRETGANILVCAPSLHNPTNSVMPIERRRELAEICRTFDVSIVEYDVNGIPPAGGPAPLIELAPERTYFVTSTWKATGMGASLGYIVAPPHAVDRLAAAVQATTWIPSPLLSEVVTAWIADGTAERIVAWHRAEIAKRLEIAHAALTGAEYRVHDASYNIWLVLPEPWRREGFTQSLAEQGVTVSPADAFAVGRAIAPHAVRLNLGGIRHLPALERALTLVGEILERGPRPKFVTT